MASGLDTYQNALIGLLPIGDCWPKEPDSELGKLMGGIAEEFTRIDERAADLLDESHPSSANELFKEWESQYGLPDACSGIDPSFQERLGALIQSYKMQGGQSREFFIEVAAAMGYVITITEYKQLRYQYSYGDLFGGQDWAFTWQVNAKSVNRKKRLYGQ
ncbi:putative phage tail protein, partial [Marinomonas sp. S3726]|uniref:YmfQ family protein n=1 Tax=Marinomonas sp. S3726 TaxID=579484 RepID=UPI0005FA52A3